MENEYSKMSDFEIHGKWPERTWPAYNQLDRAKERCKIALAVEQDREAFGTLQDAIEWNHVYVEEEKEKSIIIKKYDLFKYKIRSWIANRIDATLYEDQDY